MRRLFTAVLVGLLTVTLTASTQAAPDPAAGRYQGDGDTGGFFNVMPPGQDGVFTATDLAAYQGDGRFPEHANDQTPLYEDLVHRAGLDDPRLGITDGEITSWFKDGSFGVLGEPERVYSPTDGLTIIRDTGFGVPHIYGQTREATMFGAGYAGAEDRLFLMDVLRHLGRARLSEFLGASEANKKMDMDQLLVAPYKEEELTQQVTDICESGSEGAAVCADAVAYTAGVNQYIAEARSDPSKLPGEYPALQQQPEEWKLEDIVAIASLVGGIFGRGGGNEVANGRFLAQLQEQYGEAEGREVYEDFRSADDPDAPATVEQSFPYNQHDVIDPRSTAILDLETATAAVEQSTPGAMIADGPAGPIDLRGFRGGMSNAIVASGRSTDGGTPIAVFGPQTGYFTPQLLVEMDIHGPGIDARGVSFAGTNLYVQLGRGRDYAWSATSAGGDNVDQWVLQLCDPSGAAPTQDSTSYRHNGECKPMDVYTHRQVAKPSAGGIPDSPSPDSIVFDVEVRRTVYGPVIAEGTVDGKPVAVVEQRSTYGAELASAIGFMRVNDPDYMAGGVDSFMTAFDGVDYTFNWFYVDQEDTAYKHSCLCPIRDPRTDPDLPTWGTGQWDWTGQFLTPAQQPQSVNQAFYANWNNKQAPGFRANDANYNYSSTYRSEFLRKRMTAALESGRKLTRADMINIAEDAGTVDLNGQEIYPLALRLLDQAGSRGGAQVEQMRRYLREWVAAGGHRRDIDDNGEYDHAVAVAIGDALVKPLLDAVFGDELGDADLPQKVEDHPREGLGSAYNGGQANFLQKDFEQVLGDPLEAPRSKTYCGQGTVGSCADTIMNALAEAGQILAQEYGSDEVDSWVYDKSQDFIIQSPVGVAEAPPMEWVNRPTFQQVVQSGSRTGRIDPGGAAATARALSRHAFPGGAEDVVITSQTWQHAMAATPLAAQLKAPILVSGSNGLSELTSGEIRRLGATTAYVVGDTSVLGDRVEQQLADAGVEDIVRIDRARRAPIAAAIARRLSAPTNSVVVASARRSAESLTAAAYAGRTNRAVLLTGRNRVPKATRRALQQFDEAVIIGGTAAVSGRVVTALRRAGIDRTRRLGGPTADETSREVLNALHRERPANRDVYVVTRASRALTAGAVAAQRQGVVVPLMGGRVADSPLAQGYLRRRSGAILRMWMVDNQKRISSRERATLEELIRR